MKLIRYYAGLLTVLGTLAFIVHNGSGAESFKAENFDHDPGWEGHNNRVTPKNIPILTQDFGYSATQFASTEQGEFGGRITRSTKPAYYAKKIAPLTLNDKLAASGTFALTGTSPGSGIFFGWFNGEQPGGGGRPMGSLGLNFDGERKGGRLAVRLISGSNKSCGTFITPFIPGKFRPTPIKNDGTRYTWTLHYDPEANAGKGRFEFSLKSNSATPEDFEGKVFAVDLPEGFKESGATFDHFGVMNMMKSGGSMNAYFGDLQLGGEKLDFTKDPRWVESGNRATYPETELVGAHDFGFCPQTNFSGGKPGEMGGNIWRSGAYAYYADRVGPLDLAKRLEASGKVVLKVGAPDSDVFLGWFSSASQDKSPVEAGTFLGVHIGGPTRVGHYFHPFVTSAGGKRNSSPKGPVLTPDKVYDWSIVYDPGANDGNGEITVTLGSEKVTLPLKAGVNKRGGQLDRFGLLNSPIGGQLVRIYFDDLKYTIADRP